MKKVLVPVDFSPVSQEAYRMAQSIAAAASAQLFVLRMIDLPFLYETTFGVQPLLPSPLLAQELVNQANHDYERLKKSYHNELVNETFVVERGAVAAGILSVATEKQVDLIVMGSSGAGQISGLLMGSTANKVIRSSDLPVICVKSAIPFDAIGNIVVPVHPGGRADKLLASVKEIHAFTNARIHLLIVNTPHHFLIGNKADTILREFATQYHLEGCTFNVRNYEQEWEGILHFASEVKADLIAMETQARSGLRRLLEGSVTEHVVAHAECPVWTELVRRNDKELQDKEHLAMEIA